MIEQDTVGHVVNIASMAGVEMHIMYQSRLLLPSLSHCIMIYPTVLHRSKCQFTCLVWSMSNSIGLRNRGRHVSAKRI